MNLQGMILPPISLNYLSDPSAEIIPDRITLDDKIIATDLNGGQTTISDPITPHGVAQTLAVNPRVGLRHKINREISHPLRVASPPLIRPGAPLTPAMATARISEIEIFAPQHMW